jgi:hypothetical protein
MGRAVMRWVIDSNVWIERVAGVPDAAKALVLAGGIDQRRGAPPEHSPRRQPWGRAQIRAKPRQGRQKT